ncbi:hypothetical protein H920_12662 [Fukomys damarensis]|uniref:Uncharacterized protein n=1 Tax=Fukomys damarensis TaxID=885580 RepID=A0A091D627_FUKDA|nr:hypothetical protein H920_12662 [Fukomys damarensis]
MHQELYAYFYPTEVKKGPFLAHTPESLPGKGEREIDAQREKIFYREFQAEELQNRFQSCCFGSPVPERAFCCLVEHMVQKKPLVALTHPLRFVLSIQLSEGATCASSTCNPATACHLPFREMRFCASDCNQGP